MTTNHWRRDFLVSLGLPFLLQAVLVTIGYGVGAQSNLWVVSGLVPVLAGFVFFERALRTYVALLSLIYVPVMLCLMFYFAFAVIGAVYGASL